MTHSDPPTADDAQDGDRRADDRRADVRASDGGRDHDRGSTHPPIDSAGLRIDLPDSVRLDERFVPRIAGADSGRSVTLTARTDDGAREWASTATFEAGEDGAVDLGSVAPAGGDYDRVDAMGPVWSMTPADDGPNHRFQLSPLGSHEVTYAAGTGDRTATAAVTIHHCGPGVTRHEADDPGIDGAWFEPAGEPPSPAVLALHGSDGWPIESTAALLASHGIAALALRYLDTLDLPERPVEVPVEYVERAVDWFGGLDATADGGLGVYGRSMGGQLALLLGSRHGPIDAVVSDAGANVVFAAGEGTAPWTVDGDPLPPVRIPDGPPDRYEETVDGATVRREVWHRMLEAEETERRRAATIPVEGIDGPILLLSGSDDAVWPATTFGNMALARLDALGYGHRHEHRVYHRAGHCIGHPYRPTTWRPADGGLATGGEPAGRAAAQADAWPRVLAFLTDALG